MIAGVSGLAALLALLWLTANGLILAWYRRDLWRLWREPMFRHPILVLESDDWGAGPLAQAEALRSIADILLRHRDATGRPPVINLALVLAVPDGPAIGAGGSYRRICLDDPLFGPVLAALRDGQSRGVFALQLHGMEHYWPQVLMASGDDGVRAWLRQPVPAVTEQLPSHLQSRWVHAANLPSVPHGAQAIDVAVAEEVQAYARILGASPRVVVPPTFVWTREVERAWAGQGIECIVTPGWRYTCRNAEGVPDGDEGPIVNGDRSGSVVYVARTDYFEPVRGRDAHYALKALDRAAAQGRPGLLENHRDNFIGDPGACARSLEQLDGLYRQALARHAGLRFLSTEELCGILRAHDPQWFRTTLPERLPVFWSRLQHAGRLWKLVALTGLVTVFATIERLSGIALAGKRNSFIL